MFFYNNSVRSKNAKKYDLIFNGMPARIQGYFDRDHLIVDMHNEAAINDDRFISQQFDFPGEYIIPISSLTFEERKSILRADGSKYAECICEKYGSGDYPSQLSKEGHVLIIGSDNLDYNFGEWADSSKVTKVKCNYCGAYYRVHMEPGYRVAEMVWEKIKKS